MKSTASILFILFLRVIYLNGQSSWEIVNEGIVCTPRSVDFVNENTGWIAGNEGIYLTMDGSKNWDLINSDFNFLVIDFYNEWIGWAIVVGDSIMKTEDAGRSWLLQKNINGSIRELHAVTDSIVYVIGDSIYKTPDAGSTWENYTPSLFSDFNDASFINSDTGILISNGNIIHRTIDGGKHWNSVEVSEFSKISSLQFTDDSTGYFLARKPNDTINQYICKTIDYFNDWTVLSENEFPIQSCHFFDNGVIVGLYREYEWIYEDAYNKRIRLIKSSDGGSTWTYPETFIPLDYSTISDGSNLMHFIGNSGYYFGARNFSAFGNRNWPLDFILKSFDQGNTWSCSNISENLCDVQFLDRKKGFVLAGGRGWHFGDGTLFKTEDGGKTWSFVFHYDHNWLSSVFFLNESFGLITSYSVSPGFLFTSLDGGYSWVEDSTIGDVEELCLAIDSTVWASTDYDRIYKMNTENKKWNLFSENENHLSFTRICFLDEKTGWVVGATSTGSDNYKNQLLKYSEENGWSEVPLETDLPLIKIFFINHDVGWISGGYDNGTEYHPLFLRSEDGGESWSEVAGLNYLINDFYFKSPDHGWAVGEDEEGRGVILETFDGGLNLKVITDSLPAPLNSLDFTDGYGWAVGGRWDRPTLIMKYEMLSTFEQEDPTIRMENEFQNYPNPFQSGTMIRYQLSVFSDVELTVYDLTGREVASLVNERKAPGMYEIEWNPEGMEPGIYLCTFHTETRFKAIKMIFVQ